MMMIKNTIASVFVAIALSFIPFRTLASSASSPALLDSGEAELTAAAGAIILPSDQVVGMELSLRIGLLPTIEFAAPFGFSFRLIHEPNRGTLYFALGIADLYFPGFDDLVYRPTVMLASNLYFGRESTIRAAVDLSGAEHGIARNSHPAWIRGSVALMVDMGRVATLCAGIAYQRIVKDGEHPPKLERTGWAYDARISFGSVQTQPFSELPLLSIHLQPNLDFITISKIDINTDTGNRYFRILMGFQIFR